MPSITAMVTAARPPSVPSMVAAGVANSNYTSPPPIVAPMISAPSIPSGPMNGNQQNINPNIWNQQMAVQNAYGMQAGQAVYNNHVNELGAINQANLGQAIVASNLSSARLGSTATMAGMGIFSAGGTTYSEAMAARSAGAVAMPAFNGMGVGSFGGGMQMIGMGGDGGGYRSLSYSMNNPFGGLSLGVFNGWGGGRAVTFNPPQMGFGNFGAQTGILTPYSNYGAGSVNPAMMLDMAPANPWAVTQAQIGANFNTAANTAISNSIAPSRFTYNQIGESRGFDMGLPMVNATTALNGFNQRQQALAGLGNSISAADRSAQAFRNEAVLGQGLAQARGIQDLGNYYFGTGGIPRIQNSQTQTNTTPNLMIEQHILNQGVLGSTPNLWNQQQINNGSPHLQNQQEGPTRPAQGWGI